MPSPPVTIAIPTYQRGEVLIDTVRLLLAQTPPAAEIILVDQTPDPAPAVREQLAQWQAAGQARWLRRAQPSVPAAMNHALKAARFPVVLFLDDDIIPAPGLVAAHARNFADPDIWAVVGQILQPGQSVEPFAEKPTGQGIWRDLVFPFNSAERRPVHNGMAGNLSVRRDRALQAGGFDENFVGVAYRFETEFCRRLIRHGGQVMFDPQASLRHLQAPRGGTRTYGDHRRSASPAHGVGDYYLAYREAVGRERWQYLLRRLFREVRTRYHL